MRPLLLAALVFCLACSHDEDPPAAADTDDPLAAGIVADVIAVDVTGAAGSYTFAVTVASPDSGCAQYADWWEVVTGSGELVYRRVLLHSHVTEQPFVRTGGPVQVEANTIVWVRAHMNGAGFGGQAMRGTAAAGFVVAKPLADFAAQLATVELLPTSCAF